MRIVHAVALALLSTTAVAAQAPSGPPGSPDVSAISGGHYEADPAHTLVVWTLDHMGISPYTGIFGDVTGMLMFDPKNPSAASVDVTIPVSKVVTASQGLTDHLLRPAKDGGDPDFFGANPADARFVSTDVKVERQSATITGNLTLNGITKPVTLNARFYGAGQLPEQMGGGEALGFSGTGSIKRSDFGLGYGIPMVGDNVDLQIEAAFMKKAG
ncbi:YceI family protein [Novosphingopyxis iocasae]|uniref:YceI family protein n=1 Tax=Novosphingopyxis iocasae TaxID=2762729 RepID=UPI0016513DCD|nr:YceI family protein [Novosphingopyxis iocasae]